MSTSSEVTRTRRIHRKKYQHRIFKMRYHPYSVKEFEYIRSLAPLEDIPPSLFPTAQCPEPPVLHRAWLLDDRARRLLLQEALDRGILYWLSTPIIPAGFDFNDRDTPLEYSKRLDEDACMEEVVAVIAEEMGLKLPSLEYITWVAVPKSYSSALTVYTNRDLDYLPISLEDDIERLRVRLGFPHQPEWYPCGIQFKWVD